MARKFLYSNGLTVTQWDTEWQIPAKEAWLAQYLVQFPQGKNEIKQNYQDRITGVIQNTNVKIATDGITLHSDRMTDPILQVDPLKIMSSFDDSKTSDSLNPDYYTNQSWRTTNSAGASFTIIDEAQAIIEGFVFDQD